MKRILFPAALIAAAIALPTTSASAATLNGITPVSPKKNQSVKAGKSPTFAMKVAGEGTVWVHVCKSAKKQADGTICSTVNIGQARKSGSTFKYKPKFFDFPTFWLNTPGTYYWQAHRINCEDGNTDDCRQEGPTVKFKVRR